MRGNLTKQLLEKITGQNYDIPLGDGGLLIPRLLPDMPVKKYAVGIIPHFIEENMPELQAIQSKIPESTIISPLGNPLLTAEKIAECETVLSSSLHGLIAADAFNIPNRQMVLSNRIKGGYFKYKDYYSVYGKEIAPLTANELLNDCITADTIRNAYDIPFNQIQEIQEKLLEAFPFR
ncbi:MAG: polysaccharide pyruvyl transferase family protein [Lentisphaeria bacterium]|nr:polysaccharide pyruvyl transferase family protein [Lentisphaeria bacterium]